MNEKGPLENLLKTWETPAPRVDFEPRVLRRLHATHGRQSLWQRWLVEPWEYAASVWRPQAVAIAGVAIMVVIVGIALNASKPGASTDFGVNAFSTFPDGSFTQAYLEMLRQ